MSSKLLNILSIVALGATSFYFPSNVPVAQAQSATPIVNEVVGTFSSGSTVTINGSNFGTKTTANPVIWDNFENGASGTSIANQSPVVGSPWSVWTNGAPATYTNTVTRGASQRSALFDYTGSGYTTFLQTHQNINKAYFTFWWRVHNTGTMSANVKPWIVYGNYNGVCPSTYAGFGDPTNNDGHLRANVIDCNANQGGHAPGGSANSSWIWGHTRQQDIADHWVRFEVYLEQSDPNQSNGNYKMWVQNPDGGQPIELELNSGNLMTRDSNNYWQQLWLLGAYMTKDERSPNARAYVYGDDIYFDTTLARVELSDTATWNTNTKREIQLANTWSNNNISIRFNQGSFTNGQTAYIYVVDANGNVNQNGYPVTIAGVITPPATDTQVPTTPTNLTASATSTQINLSWTESIDNVGVIGYQILRSTTNGSGYTQIATSTTNSYTNTGLTAGATYYYVVRAFDAVNNFSANSNQAQATVPTTVVAPPSLPFNGQQWSRVYLKDFEDSQILENGKFTVHLGLPIASGYQITTENGNKILQGNLGSSGDKRSQVLMLNLANMGIDPHGEFYLKTKVKIRPNNLWCVASDYGAMPSTICPNGRDGAKLSYAFGPDGVYWIPGMGFPPAESGFGQWKFTDNRGNGTGSGYQRYFDNASNVTVDDGQWHEWIWHFKHNTQSNGSWNSDGIYEFYIDGLLAARATDVPYTTVVNGTTTDGSFTKISKPISYFGGGGTLANDWIYWVDNIEVYKPASVINPPTDNNNYSPWCSALLGIVSSAVSSGVYSRVADINSDNVVNITDLTLVQQYYNNNNDNSCQARFINTYTSNNYLNVNWCAGIIQGLSDRYNSSTGLDSYSSIFDLNNDGLINLTDTVLVSQYNASNNQAACFAEYALPLNTATQAPKQAISKLPSTSLPSTNSILVTKVNATKTEAAKLSLLKGRFVQLSDGTNIYVNYKGKTVLVEDGNITDTLAKQALGISKDTLAKLSVSLSYNGVDSDGDSVADEIEKVIGTDPNNKDTDGDGYADGVEMENYYSPLKNTPKARLDKNLAKRLGGRILIVVPGGSLFYVNPTTYKLELLKDLSLENLGKLGLIKEVKGIKISK